MTGIGYTLSTMDKWTAARPWTEADLAALHELAPTCTLAQLAAYLGRTAKSVEHKISKLRSAGEWTLPRRTDSGRSARRSAFCIPSNAILLAKTCPECGCLLDARRFRARKRTSGVEWSMRCKSCENARQQGKPSRLERLKRSSEKQVAINAAIQAVTMEHAHRGGEQYTSAELEIAADVDRSDFEVAISLGRTFYAIRGLRSRLQVKSRPGRTQTGRWLVEFPHAMRVLQEQFRELGVVPESEWEWDDERVSA